MKIEILNLEDGDKKVRLDNEEYESHIIQIKVGSRGAFAVNRNELMSALIAFDAYDSRQNPQEDNCQGH